MCSSPAPSRILLKAALLISGARKAGTCFVFYFFLVLCFKWDSSFFLPLENIKLWPWNMHNKLRSSPRLFTAQSQFVFYPSHLLLHSLPAACLLPFHCLLVFGQSIPEKGILKKRWGRLAKPSECLPVLSKVPTDRAEGACAHTVLWLSSTDRVSLWHAASWSTSVNIWGMCILWATISSDAKRDTYLKKKRNLNILIRHQKSEKICLVHSVCPRGKWPKLTVDITETMTSSFRTHAPEWKDKCT